MKYRILRIFNIRRNLAKDERYVDSIISRYLETDVQKIMTPYQEYLIIDEDNQIYLSLYNDTITISNHDFLYRESFSNTFCRSLEKKIRKKMKEEHIIMKNLLFKNKIDLLAKIKEKIQ